MNEIASLYYQDDKLTKMIDFKGIQKLRYNYMSSMFKFSLFLSPSSTFSQVQKGGR